MHLLLLIAFLGQSSVRDGSWHDAATWDRLPGPKDDVTIKHTVTVIDSVTACTITVAEGGTLQIGTPEKPAELTVTFSDSPIDTAKDPMQLGHGLLVFGKLRVHGAPKTAHVRIDGELAAGTTSIPIKEPVRGWQVGDTVYIPDTRQPDGPYNPASRSLQEEFRKIKGITDTALLLDVPLTYAHKGARDADGNLLFTCSVANLTRSVLFRSANPAGTRAHTYFNRYADVWLKHAAFVEMGRTKGSPLDSTRRNERGQIEKIGTNQIGRYPVHFHHCQGPRAMGKRAVDDPGMAGHESEYATDKTEFTPSPLTEPVPENTTVVEAKDDPKEPKSRYQFECVGNVVWSANPIHRWGITVHQSHYGLIADNIVVCCAGSGIVTEDGNETGNIFENNFVSHVTGEGRPDGRQNEIGFEGSAYWFRGPNNIVRNNQAYDAQDGYIYYARFASKSFRYPTIPGESASFPIDPTHFPILEFSGNEVCGCRVGFSAWWIGAIDRTPIDRIATSTIRDLTCWHTRSAVSGYETANFHYVNLTAIGDPKLVNDQNGGWGASDYIQYRTVIEGGRIENYSSGIRVPSICDRLNAVGTNPGLFVIQGIRLRNRQNISVPIPWHNATATGLPPITVHLENVQLEPLVQGPEQKHVVVGVRAAEFSHYTQWVNVWSHGTDHRRFFGTNQDPEAILPPSGQGGRIVGAPESIRNLDAWNTYGFVGGGELAPENALRSPEIGGSYIEVDGKKPYIWPVPDLTMAPGQRIRAYLCAYDPTLGELEYRIAKGPEGMAIENRSGLFNWRAPESTGEYPVTLEVRDVDDPDCFGQMSFVIHVVSSGSGSDE